MKGYKKLVVWQRADELAFNVYLETKKFPKEEIYGITSQLRRAVLSVPTNLGECTGRQGKKEQKHFANIALGSLAETEYLLGFCLKLNYLDSKKYLYLEKLRHQVGCLLWRFYQSFD